MTSEDEYTPSALSQDPDYTPPPRLFIPESRFQDLKVITPSPKMDQGPIASNKKERESFELLIDEAYDLIEDLGISIYMDEWKEWNREYNKILGAAIKATTEKQIRENNSEYYELLTEIKHFINAWKKFKSKKNQ